jgi:alpha-amylase
MDQWPLTAQKYACWIHDAGQRDAVINLVMNYETFGEHQRQIRASLIPQDLPQEILRFGDNAFKTPSEIAAVHDALTSWIRRISSTAGYGARPVCMEEIPCRRTPWRNLYRMENVVKSQKTKRFWPTGENCSRRSILLYVHQMAYSPQTHKYACESPYDLYVSFMNVLDHLELRCLNLLRDKEKSGPRPQQPIQSIPAIANDVNSTITWSSEGTKR